MKICIHKLVDLSMLIYAVCSFILLVEVVGFQHSTELVIYEVGSSYMEILRP